MKYSLTLASVTLALVGTACGGFTEVGQGAGGSSGRGGNVGAAGQGGKPSGGAPGAGGAAVAGHAGDQGTANAPSTGGVAGSSCEHDTDCPEVELCALCADGNCAEQRCLNGACKLTCDTGGGGACSEEGASCANGEACCDGLECCSGVPVPVGSEYCGKVCPKSDVNIKRDFMSVDPNEVLDKLSRLPIGVWSYQTEGSTVRHIGPMAQDFMATFGVGSSDRTILQVDADGVSFAAIQALSARLTLLEEKNAKLQRELDEQRHRCER